jgi:hypothetical protein
MGDREREKGEVWCGVSVPEDDGAGGRGRLGGQRLGLVVVVVVVVVVVELRGLQCNRFRVVWCAALQRPSCSGVPTSRAAPH